MVPLCGGPHGGPNFHIPISSFTYLSAISTLDRTVLAIAIFQLYSLVLQYLSGSLTTTSGHYHSNMGEMLRGLCRGHTVCWWHSSWRCDWETCVLDCIRRVITKHTAELLSRQGSLSRTCSGNKILITRTYRRAPPCVSESWCSW